MIFNVTLGLLLVIGFPLNQFGVEWSGFGFPACPSVTVFAEIVQAVVLIGYFTLYKQLYRDWWPNNGWSWSNVTLLRVKRFLKLYVVRKNMLSIVFCKLSVCISLLQCRRRQIIGV